MGNSGSLLNMFRYLGIEATIEDQVVNIAEAKKIVLPGVGAFDAAMRRIHATSGLLDVLHDKAQNERIPILGICLGMQLLTRRSDEGILPGLGWIPAETRRFPSGGELKVPHMGWNVASPMITHPLFSGLLDLSRYYFVHSYYVSVDHTKYSFMHSNYGIRFDSAIGSDNIFGVQFHPEKSHRYGMQILENFAGL